MDFDAISEALNTPEVEEEEQVTVQVVSFAGQRKLEVTAGTTISELKEEYDLDGVKLVTEEGVILRDTDVIEEDMVLITSASKENGK